MSKEIKNKYAIVYCYNDWSKGNKTRLIKIIEQSDNLEMIKTSFRKEHNTFYHEAKEEFFLCEFNKNMLNKNIEEINFYDYIVERTKEKYGDNYHHKCSCCNR